MPAPLPIGFNFRQALAFVDDVAPDVYQRTGGVTPYDSGSGYGMSGDSGLSVDNRSASVVDVRLAGCMFTPNNNSPANCEHRCDVGPGDFNFCCALGDAGDNSGPHVLRLYDGASTTPIATISVGTTTPGQWYDATGVLRTSDTAWRDNNAKLLITLTSTYLRVRAGDGAGSGSTYTALSHYSLEEAPPAAPTLSLPGVQDITSNSARPKVTLTF